MSGGLPVGIAFLDKRNNTRTQFYRMRLAHGGSPSMEKENHKSAILEPESGKAQPALGKKREQSSDPPKPD
jgi:hypothetical protein